jgi:hypothetical protein
MLNVSTLQHIYYSLPLSGEFLISERGMQLHASDQDNFMCACSTRQAY